MSFYTALTGLNGAQSDISATSNNIANVGTTGFKKVERNSVTFSPPPLKTHHPDRFWTILKGIKQQFTQGNISSSLNALDLAISGQGFLRLSLPYVKNSLHKKWIPNVNNDRYVVDSAGQYLCLSC